MGRLRLTAGLMMMLGLTGSLMAQAPGKAGGGRAGVNQRFGGGPGVGKSLPDVDCYDAEGDPFNLRSLKGNYTVLVFGCLT